MFSIWSILSDHTTQLRNSNIQALQLHASTIALHLQKHISEKLEQGEGFVTIGTGLTQQLHWMRQNLPYQEMLTHLGIVASTGRILSHTNTALMNQMLPEETTRKLSSAKEVIFLKENDNYNTYVPLMQNQNLYGFVLIGFSEAAVDDPIGENFQHALLTIIKAVVIFVIIISIFLTLYVAPPFDQIIKQVENIEQSKNLSLRLPLQSKDELGQIAQKVNQLLESLEKREKAWGTLSQEHEGEMLYFQKLLEPLAETTQKLRLAFPRNMEGTTIESDSSHTQEDSASLQKMIETHHALPVTNGSPNSPLVQLNRETILTIAADIVSMQKGLPFLLKLSQEHHSLLQELNEVTPYPEELLNQKTANFEIHKVRLLEPPQGIPARVVIFDDFEMTRFAYAQTLENTKEFEVVGSFGNADNCAEICKELTPHLVLMDIDMKASMNGIDATQALTTLFPNVCVVILSIHRSPYFITRALAAGARAYLSKKTSLTKLPTILKMSLDNCVIVNEASAVYYLNYQKFSEIFTSTELRVFMELLEGYTAKEIAEHLGTSSKTIENHIHNILRKSNTSREEITKYFVSI